MSDQSADGRPHRDHEEHSLKTAALQYARRGIPVFPVHSIDARSRCTCGGESVDLKTGEVIPCREGSPGKHPRVSGGFKAATTDQARVEAWWTQWPDANIAMPTGEASGIDVIDDDRQRKGLPLDGVAFPTGGPSTITGGGGHHAFVRHREGVRSRTNNPVPGIDVRGDGGYVLLPPSNHMSGGSYRWERGLDHDLGDGPEWLTAPRSSEKPRAEPVSAEERLPLHLLAQALDHATGGDRLDPSDYDTWIKVGMALRHGHGDAAFDVWDTWSKRAPNYGQTEKKWPTFTTDGNARGQVVTSDWIIVKAIDAGWEPPLKLAQHAGSATQETEKPPVEASGESKPAGPTQVEEDKPKSPEPEPYPLELFPENWAAFATEVSRALCTDVAVVGTIELVVFAAAIGYSRALKDSYSGWRELAAIWAAVVMISGGRKSPAFSAVTKPLRAIQHDEYREWKKGKDKHQQELVAWKEKKKNERGDPPDSPPPLVHLYSTNATPEKLAEILGDQARGTAFLPPELAGMFAALGYKKGAQALKDLALFLSSFNAEGAKYDRVIKGTVWIPSPLISIVGTIQPGLAARLFSDEEIESGLAARFLFLYREPLPKRYGPGPGAEVQKWWADLVRWAYFQLDMVTAEDGETQEPLELDIDEGAREMLRDFVPTWDTESSREPGAVRAALAKLEGYALRFALLFRLLREHGGHAGRADPISREDLQRGIALARWYRAEAIRAYEGLLAEGRAERRSRLLVQIVRHHHGMVTAREWGRARNITSAEAERELRELVEVGLLHPIEIKSGPDGGRPTTGFVAVDPVRVLSRPLSRPEVSSALSGGQAASANLSRPDSGPLSKPGVSSKAPGGGGAPAVLSGPVSGPEVSSSEEAQDARRGTTNDASNAVQATPGGERRNVEARVADETPIQKGGPESPQQPAHGHQPTDETPVQKGGSESPTETATGGISQAGGHWSPDETAVRKGGLERSGPESPEPDWDEAAWQVDPLDALLNLLERKGPSTWTDLKAAARYLRTEEGRALFERAIEEGDVIREEAASGGRPRVTYRLA